jgi:O-antigen/teichoic acid export membrane protein
MPDVRASRNFKLGGRTIREHAARGTLVNAVFLISLTFLGFLKGFILAGFLSRDDYGIWGILVVGLGTLVWLKQVGIGDKYIQQDEEDQVVAFQKAFTLEAIFTLSFCVFLAACLPIVALAYGQWKIIGPGVALILVLPAGILQAPLWVYYRDMDFVKQRLLQAAEPVVGFILAIVLALMGAGYWALVLSVVAGAWVTAAIAVVASPYPMRFHYERGTARSYISFSWPLMASSLASLATAQASILMSNARLGLAAAGTITLAATVTQFTDRVDQIVTGTLYPAICAAKDRKDVLFESFVKSNRLALMWAVPFGVGVSLFAADLVHFAIGNRWEPAIPVLQVFGATAAFGHFGFNWDAYFRARGETRPIAYTGWIAAAAFFVVGVPLLYAYGLVGFAFGLSAQVLVHVICRAYFLSRLFDGFAMLRHMLRSVAPTVPAAAIVLIARALERQDRTEAIAVIELFVYVVVTALGTAIFERPLVREALGYVRGGRAAPAPS